MVAPAIPIGYGIAAGALRGAQAYRAYRAAQAAKKLADAAKAAAAADKSAKCTTGDCEPDCDKMQFTGKAAGGMRKFMDDLCKKACECQQNRGGSSTFQKCVEKKIREEYPDRTPQRDGPHPEVSHRDNGDGYDPVMSRREPGRFSNAPVVSGAPRPDISYYEGGKLSKLVEMKFPGDRFTDMQARGDYKDILRSNNLDPDKDLLNVDVGDQCQIPTN